MLMKQEAECLSANETSPTVEELRAELVTMGMVRGERPSGCHSAASLTPGPTYVSPQKRKYHQRPCFLQKGLYPTDKTQDWEDWNQ